MSGRLDHLIWTARHSVRPPVYLFGTMHLDCDLFPELQERCLRLVESIDLLATEIDLESMENTAFPMLEQGIQDHLSPQQYERLRDQLIRFLNLTSCPGIGCLPYSFISSSSKRSCLKLRENRWTISYGGWRKKGERKGQDWKRWKDRWR